MKKILGIILEIFMIYSFCGGFYIMVETCYRACVGSLPTDIGMFYLGGLIGLIAYFINDTILDNSIDLTVQCSIMTLVSTFFEGLYGNIFNTDYSVWDYRNLPLSFWNDQCNVFFCICWFILMVIAIPLLDYIDYKCFNGIKPKYKILGKEVDLWTKQF